jgi:hypothetical protein
MEFVSKSLGLCEKHKLVLSDSFTSGDIVEQAEVLLWETTQMER